MNEFLFENKEDYIDYLKSMQSISILENKTYDELELVSTYVENSGLDENINSFVTETRTHKLLYVALVEYRFGLNGT